jgi:hypothetical protein
MNILQRRARVREAQVRMHTALRELRMPTAALLARGRRHPLGTVGTAAGAGFVLGRLNVHPLRVPGLGALLGGGMAEAVAYGVRLIAELDEVAGPAATGRPADRTQPQGDLFDRPGGTAGGHEH